MEPGLVQVASISADPSSRAQGEALAAMAARAGTGRRRTPPPDRLASAPLPERDAVRPIPPGGLAAVIGRADVTGEPAVVDLEWSHLAVYGPPRSGRSTALAVIVTQLVEADTGIAPEVVVAAPASSPLRTCTARPGVAAAFGREIGPMLASLPDDHRAPRVVVVDDLDTLDDPALVPAFERLARDETTRFVVASEPRTGFSTNPLVALARRARRMLVLQPDDPAEFLQLTGSRLVLRPGLRLPPGRGVLLVDRVSTVVQVVDASAWAGRAPLVDAARGTGP